MTLNVRQRIVLTLLAVGLIVAAVVAAGLILMIRLQERVPADVAQKTERVRAMQIIRSDLDRIDASFQAALGGSRIARQQHEEIWRALDKRLSDAERNADAGEEQEIVMRLTRVAGEYRRQGEGFYARAETDRARNELYYRPHGLLAMFRQVSKVVGDCLNFEQVSMGNSVEKGQSTIANSLLSFEVMFGLTIVLAGLAAAYRIRVILQPSRPAVAPKEHGGGPAIEPDFAGPICLCSLAVWLAVICAWNSVPPRPVSRSAIALLTSRGIVLYHPEYDIPIYLGGLAVAILAAVVWAFVWHRRWEAAASEGRRGDLRGPLKFHKWCALGCIAVACVYPTGPVLNAYCAGLAGLATVLLWYESKRTVPGAAPPSASTLRQRRPATVSHARQVGRGRADRSGRGTPAAPADVSFADAADSNPARRPRIAQWGAIAAIAVVALLLYIPDPAMVVARSWEEHFHHWNFYLVGPFLGFQHGAALGSQCYTQYGVGWPVVVSALSHFQPITYEWLIRSATVYGCIYFVILFFFLRSFTGSTAWGFAGLLFSLYLQAFSGMDFPIWLTPSSSVLRAPFDVIVYWAALKHAQSEDWRWGGLIGGAAGLNLLFGSDTGIYLMAAVLFYGALCWAYRPGGKRLLNVPFALGTLISMLAVFLGGLIWASRGTCFQPGFWPSYWEAILLYVGGMSSAPMSGGIEGRQEFVVLTAALMTYTFAIGSALFRFLLRKLEASDLVLALVAASGLGMLLLFINRSHPFSLYHPIIPFCIIAAQYASRWTASRSEERSTSAARNWGQTPRVPVVLIGVLLAALATNPQVRSYPSLLVNFVRSFGPEPVPGSGSAAPAKGGLAARADYRKELRPLVEALRDLSEGGRHSVAVLAQNDTPLLMLTDMAPYFRYSPAMPIIRHQTAVIEQKLIDDPPDSVLYCNEWPPEMQQSWEKLLSERYRRERDVQEGWSTWRRIKPSS